MVHKKLISLLLIVGLFSSATMHPIWGFDWLFGSSNQTTVNNQKRNELLFIGSVAAVVGIGIYAGYYWNKNITSKKTQPSTGQAMAWFTSSAQTNSAQVEDQFPLSLVDDGEDDHKRCIAPYPSNGRANNESRPQEPGLVPRDWSDVPQEERDILATQQRNSPWRIRLVRSTSAVMPTVGLAVYDEDGELTV